MELKDPKKNRKVNYINLPNHKKLPHNDIFDINENIIMDWKSINNHFLREGRLEDKTIKLITHKAKQLLEKEPNLLYLQDPLYIIGDIHGQYFDLNTIFQLVGDPNSMKYLFLGDYVDRGSFGIECILMLLILKILYPNNVFWLRGNHESRELTSYFNFKMECLYKYSENIYEYLTDSFDKLPFSCIINGRFLALHGGISPNMIFCTDFNKINRFQEPPKQGILCDSLWADPVDDPKGNIFGSNYKFNESRGCSYFFGYEASKELLKNNELLMIIRAHEAQIEGFKAHLWGYGNKQFPQVLTIFSAPNYCGCYGNKGAIININNNNLTIKQFNNKEHPYFLPNFLNIFNWSLPFIAEKLYEMGYAVLKENLGDDDEVFEDDYILEDHVYKMLNIKKPDKVKKNTSSTFDSKLVMDKMGNIKKKMKTIKDKRRKSIQQITNIDMNGSQLSLNLLDESEGDGGLFDKVKNIDSVNEKRPKVFTFEDGETDNKIIPDKF